MTTRIARRPRSPRVVPLFPRGVERRYLAHLRQRISVLVALVKRVVLPTVELGAMPSGAIEIPDTVKPAAEPIDVKSSADLRARVDGLPESFALLELLRKVFADQAKPDERFLAGLTAQVDTAATSFQVDLIAGVIPIPLPFDPRPFIDDNVKLITSIDERFLDDVAEILTDAQLNGWDLRRTTQALNAATGSPLNRAKLIARDQIATVNSQISKQRQIEAGVNSYRWSTSQDERVRPEHREREGRIFEWDAPPPDGHPGEPINCRCVAIPVFDD